MAFILKPSLSSLNATALILMQSVFATLKFFQPTCTFNLKCTFLCILFKFSMSLNFAFYYIYNASHSGMFSAFIFNVVIALV